MKHGDLSSDLAPTIGIRFESVIKTADGKLNKSAKGFLQHVLQKVGHNIYIITTGDRRKALAFCVKWGIPWTQVVEVDSILEIPSVCIENDMQAYYDTDQEVLMNVRARGQERVRAEEWI